MPAKAQIRLYTSAQAVGGCRLTSFPHGSGVPQFYANERAGWTAQPTAAPPNNIAVVMMDSISESPCFSGKLPYILPML